MRLPAIIVAALLFPSAALAEKPPEPPSSFSAAKKIARNEIYGNPDDRTTIYCGCSFTNSSTASGGKISTRNCEYRPRKNRKRGKVLEWEHVVPAQIFGGDMACWTDGDDACVTGAGKKFKGRKCCSKVSDEFEMMEADLHNLTPSVGEVNGDRSNHPHGMIADADDIDYRYGQCPFVVSSNKRGEDGKKRRIAEPSPINSSRNNRGDIARIWFYMADTYDVDIPDAWWNTFVDWADEDPIDDVEIARDQRIFEAQGNHNAYVFGDDD